ncbi:MAG: HAMP domain-containing histidine kinase [Candidatus Eremiobacteraeota bacterium]|nr:HAMP domain-containing histidine kinase [Candidatus Eremiobacteraeota bacterium]
MTTVPPRQPGRSWPTRPGLPSRGLLAVLALIIIATVAASFFFERVISFDQDAINTAYANRLQVLQRDPSSERSLEVQRIQQRITVLNKRLRTTITSAIIGMAFFTLLVTMLAAYYETLRLRRMREFADALNRRNQEILGLNAFRSDLIALLAHDIKGPLTNVIGFAELADLDDTSREERSEYLKTIVDTSKRLAALANDTLAMSDLERNGVQIDEQPVDLISMIREVASGFANERGVVILARSRSVQTHGDQPRLYQVFENLIGNAIKYSPTGAPVEVTLEQNADHVVVAIKDRGIGVPVEEIPLLFQRFMRGSNARRLGIEGTGLGLFLVRYIVEQHGGTVEITSSSQNGTVVTVALPFRRTAATGQSVGMQIGATLHAELHGADERI